MNLKKITDLIAIRNYISTSIENFTISKDSVRFLSKSLIMIDNKILSLLMDNEFKTYIDYVDIDKSIKDSNQNLKSSLQR